MQDSSVTAEMMSSTEGGAYALIASASLWIAQNLCHGSSRLHADRLTQNAFGNQQSLSVTPQRPAGLRDIWSPGHPAVEQMRCRLHGMGIPSNPDQIPMPASREQITPYLAARYPFLFDRGREMAMASQSHQSTGIEDAYLHVAGWTFEDVEAVYLFAWDNHRHGGRGRASFDRLWIRDLDGFCDLYPDSSRSFRLSEAFDDLRNRIKTTAANPIAVVRHIAEDLFELERGMDCLVGLTDLREMLRQARREDRLRLFASVSPLLVSVARTHPEILSPADHKQHAGVTAGLSDSLTIASRGIEPDKELTEARFLGWSDLQYVLHLFSEMGHRKVEKFGYHAGSAEHDELRSKIFRLAINFIAHHDPGRAAAHLAKRLSEEDHKHASDEILHRKRTGWSVFDGSPDAETTEDADAQDEPLAVVLAYCLVGASYVDTFRKESKRLSEAGILDPAKNPAARAFFSPEAWTQTPATTTLLAARDDWSDELAVLDRRYVAEKRKRHLQTSAFFASRLSECIIAPFTLRAFGVKLPDAPENPATGKEPRSNKRPKSSLHIESGGERAQNSAISVCDLRTRERSKLLLNRR
ncbi:hypothetical protein A3748_09450 [Erythrobacter sp. HI0077]|nr:hypothetical protein A3745_01815 [Erythrobacter sp. HI0074]KZZ09058.1 hypothetical protein A3748_09450 [Erythrobacter sp. HI0077]